jgi:hypothetical protein
MQLKTFSLTAVMALIQLMLVPPLGASDIVQQFTQKLAQLNRQIADSPKNVDLRNRRAMTGNTAKAEGSDERHPAGFRH